MTRAAARAEPVDPLRGRVAAPVLDDHEIVAGVRGGDEDAAAALHDRVRPTIDRTLLRVLGRVDGEHDDLAERAFVQIVYSLTRYRGECSLDTWAARITANTAYKELRTRRRARRVFAREVEVESVDEAVDGEASTVARSTLSRVQHHLDALDPDKAWTLVLHDVCGYDLREIAEITSVSVSAAQTRLVRGRRELHERIASDPELAEALTDRANAARRRP